MLGQEVEVRQYEARDQRDVADLDRYGQVRLDQAGLDVEVREQLEEVQRQRAVAVRVAQDAKLSVLDDRLRCSFDLDLVKGLETVGGFLGPLVRPVLRILAGVRDVLRVTGFYLQVAVG